MNASFFRMMPILCTGILLNAAVWKAEAQTNPLSTLPPVQPLPVSTGVIPLPHTTPPTGLSMRVPNPALPSQKADSPLLYSPRMQQLGQMLRTKPLTLKDAIALALSLNPQLAQAVAHLLTIQGNTSAARAALNPTLGVNTQLTYFDAPTNAVFGATKLTLVNQFNPVVTATANLPIDLFGVLRNTVSQAQFEQLAARIAVNATRNQIVYNVENAFYAVLHAQAAMAVASESLRTNLSQLDSAQKNYAAGTAARFDVLTSQTNVASAQDQFLQTERQVSLSLIALKLAIGLRPDSPLKISDANAVQMPPNVAPPAKLPAPGLQKAPETPQFYHGISPRRQIQKTLPQAGQVSMPEVEGAAVTISDPLPLSQQVAPLLKEAENMRPEMQAAEAQLAAARRGIQLARASMLPSISLQLSYQLTPNAAGFTRYNQALASINFEIPLLDGGLENARLKQARGDVAQAEIARRETRDQIDAQVEQAYIALLQARDRVAVANVALTQARESYRLAQVRYNAGVVQQSGVSPILELSSSQASLTQAESSQVTALYDYNTARAALDEALGRYAAP